MVQRITILLWAAFFFSPLFWPKIIDNLFAVHLLALAMGLVAAAWMGANARTDRHASPFSWLLLLLLLVPIVLQLAGGELRNPWRAFEMALYVGSTWLAFQMCREGAAKMLGSHRWSLLLALAGNICVLFAVLQQFHLPLFHGFELFPIWQEFPRAFAGIQVQQNLQGLFLILICMSLWSRGMTESRAWPWWLASVLPCSGVLVTSSRGSALVLAVGAVMLIYMAAKRRTAALNLAGVLLLAVLFSQYWHMYPEITGSEPTLGNRLTAVGIQARLFIWDMCWQLFVSHPWLGIGAGNLVSYGTEAIPPVLAAHPEFAAVASKMSGGHAFAHNLVLQFMMEWGVFGGVAVIGFIGLVAVRVGGMLRQRNVVLVDGKVQGGVGALLMLLHGMFSVSMMLGYFLVLLALYSAALFPGPTSEAPESGRRLSLGKALFFLPALFVLYNWYLFVDREWKAEASAYLSVHDPAFARNVGEAVDNPWSADAALQWYMRRLVAEHDAGKIVASANFFYRYWMIHESSFSLAYLILLAHLKDDIYAERRWVALFRAAYPENKLSPQLKEHVEHGHSRGEPLDF